MLNLRRLQDTQISHYVLTVRLCLAVVNTGSLCFLRRAVTKRYGFGTSVFFTIITCSQFHLPFWMGRTIPNMFALAPCAFYFNLSRINRKPSPIVTVGFSYMINRMPNTKRPSPAEIIVALSIQTFAAVVLRVEVSLLVGFLVMQCFLSGWMSLARLLKVCTIAGLLSAGTYPLNVRFMKFPDSSRFSNDSRRGLILLGTMAHLA